MRMGGGGEERENEAKVAQNLPKWLQKQAKKGQNLPKSEYKRSKRRGKTGQKWIQQAKKGDFRLDLDVHNR